MHAVARPPLLHFLFPSAGKIDPIAGLISLALGCLTTVALVMCLIGVENMVIAAQHQQLKEFVKNIKEEGGFVVGGLARLLATPEFKDIAAKLKGARLTPEAIKNTSNDLLLDSLLEKAGISAPGDRLAIISAARK